MQLFFSDRKDGNRIILDESESKHCVQVLRKSVGDQVHVLNGSGGWFVTTLVEGNKKKCILEVVEEKMESSPDFHLHIGIAPPKNLARLEWFLEKSTEMGIGEISLLQCQRSERKKVKIDRLRRILVASMKQSF